MENAKKWILNNQIWIIAGLIFAVVAIIYWRFLVWAVAVNTTDQGNSGTLGDTFGLLNALFSGLAFAGLIVTILLQSRELGLQRQELAETRAELQGQKVELEKQNQLIADQRWEDTFFRLLELHRKQFDSVTFEVNSNSSVSTQTGRKAQGKDAFTIVIDTCLFYIMPNNIQAPPTGEVIGASDGTLKKAVVLTILVTSSNLAPYLSTLQNFIKFTRQHREAPNYVSIIADQLTMEEKIVLLLFGAHQAMSENICSELKLSMLTRAYLRRVHQKGNKFLDEVMTEEEFRLVY
ncbi:MAG: hypothetical protein SFU83_13280 [Meiothermus sp.]|nr:hypothetical protein [Meiothermus sp.]